MKTNEAGRLLIIEFEGLRTEAYQCTAGKWTIGFGHTGKEVTPGLVWTEEKAWKVLGEDIEHVERQVAAAVHTCLNENQFSALVSFVFNIGIQKFLHGDETGGPCDLLAKINGGDAAGAAQDFGRWVYSGGKVTTGLVVRRAAERKLFETPMPQVA